MTRPGIPKWITESKEGVILKLHIQPKASISEISGEYGERESIRLKIRIAAPPVDGEANEELIRFLRKLTKISASRIFIIRGESSKAKDVLIQGSSVEEIKSLVES